MKIIPNFKSRKYTKRINMIWFDDLYTQQNAVNDYLYNTIMYVTINH